MKESAVTSHVRLDAAQRNVMLLRNNSGGFFDEKNRFVRYGLGSFDPEKDELASSDWIGWTPTFIMPHHVGTFLPVFTAVETKKSDFVFYKSDKRSCYQKNFIDMVLAAGGNAGFALNVADFRRIIKHEC
jgi:hypothetical protein